MMTFLRSWRILRLGIPLLVMIYPASGAEETETRPNWLQRLRSNYATSAKFSADWITESPPPRYQPDTNSNWSSLGWFQDLSTGSQASTTNASRALLVNNKEVWHLDKDTAVGVAFGTVVLQSGRAYYRSHGEIDSNLWLRVKGAEDKRVTGTDFQVRRDNETGPWFLTLIQGRVGDLESSNALKRAWGIPQVEFIVPGGSITNWLTLPELRRDIQWILRYPAVLHVDDIPWPGESVPEALVESLRAYESGNLQEAWKQYEIAKTNLSPTLYSDPTLVIYRSNLLLGRGRVDEIETNLVRIASLPVTNESLRKLRGLVYAILKVAAAVRAEDFPGGGLTNRLDLPDLEPTSATEWLAESYYQQSRIRRAETNLHFGWTNTVFCRPPSLQLALEAAKRSTDTNSLGTNFWFGWIRKADLEFSHGNLAATEKALETLLANKRTNALTLTLKGFVLAARPNLKAQREALSYFARALEMDPDFTDSWLGLGLLYLRGVESPKERGLPFDTPEKAGLACLEQAVALEPARSLLRSYLGKAQYDAAETKRAFGIIAHYDTNKITRAYSEFDTAKNLDPNDPTPWLYSGLAKHSDYRVNEAVRDLERSIELNDNRAVYRSDLMLDQDRAVRGANLAAIYRDAGLFDVSVREASRDLNYDYANGSAHLFLANSYDALRDPQQVNLRYETPWLNELLLANLLKPVGAGSLSQTISQQEYSRLFERDHLGVSSLTEYGSNGDWLQSGSLYFTKGPVAASFDVNYLSQNGYRPNQDQENLALWGKVKYQISPYDSILVQILYADIKSGDLAQYYDPASARTGLRIHETEEPIVLAGYHHQWAGAPEHNTLVLFSRLDNTLTQTEANHTNPLFFKNPDGSVDTNFVSTTFLSDLAYQSRLDIYSTELQHIWQQEGWCGSTVFGARVQFGEFETEDRLANPHGRPIFPPVLFPSSLGGSQVSSDFNRYSAYAYQNLEFKDIVRGSDLLFTVGVSYDYLDYPVNHRVSPVTDAETHRDQVSPKVGAIWTLDSHSTLRASYTRSLGGVSLDQSFRLEPVQVGGFLQSFRSLIPESVAGALAAPTFETWGLGYDRKFGNDFYAGVTGEWLTSEADKAEGVFDSVLGQPVSVSNLGSTIDFRERNLGVDLGYLACDELSFNFRYRLSHAEYAETFGSAAIEPRENSALLHEANFNVLFNHSFGRTARQSLQGYGFFSLVEAIWRTQSNYDYVPDLPGANVWQFNVYAGFRFPRRAAELSVGILNLTDQDYRFNPLNLQRDLPRERTFVLSLRFNLEAGL